MTDGRHPTSGCVDAETLAAFINGRLEPRERAAVEAHLAGCADCYEVWMESASANNPATSTPGLKVQRAWRPWLLTFGSAAAVLMMSIWLWPVSDKVRIEQALDVLVDAVGPRRPALGRFSVAFHWAEVPPATRSGNAESVPLPVQQAALSIRILASERESAEATRALGIAEVAEGRLDEGIRALEASVTANSTNADSHADLSAALLERWNRFRSAQDATRALNEAQLAAATAPRHLSALFNLALAAEAVGDVQGAVRAWKSYLALDNESAWAREGQRRLDELERAVKRLTERKGVNEADVPGVAMRSGQPGPLASALLAMRRSRDKFDRSDHLGSAAEARNAARLFKAAKVPTLEADMQVAWALFFAGRRAEGLDIAKRVASSSSASSMPRELGRFHYLAGLDTLGVSQRTQAVAHYQTAMRYFERAGDAEQVAATHAMLAEALRSQGDSAGNWEHLSKALAALPALSTARRQVLILSGATQAASQAGYVGAALWFSEGLEAAVKRTADPGAHVTLTLLRAPLLVRLGDVERARSLFASGRDAATRFPDAETQQRYQGEVGWQEGRALHDVAPLDAIRGLTAAAGTFEQQRLPFRLAEVYLYRGRAHRTNGDREQAERDWARGIAVLRSQAAGISDRRLRATWADGLWGLYSEIIDSHIDRPMTALAWLEASKRPLDTGPDNAEAPPAPVAIPTSAFGSDVVVVLASLPNRLLKWTFTSGEPAFSSAEVGTAELATLVDAFVSALAAGKLLAPNISSRLAALVLPTSIPPGLDDSVVFVSDGPLRMFPFGALRVPATGQLLIEAAVPRLVSRLSDAARPRINSPVEARPLLVGVGASGGSGLQYLPNAKAEVETIAGLYDAGSPIVLVDASATRRAVLARLRSTSLIHFATHAVVDGQKDAAALVLHSDAGRAQTLTTDDILTQTLRSGSLVILSACETAVGAVTASSTSVSLAHAFLTAGASAVIGTLWELPDDDALTLMTYVHTRLRAGRASHRALADAQRHLLKSNPGRSTWAALAHIAG